MIYTRNKDSFKTKTVKTIISQGSSSSRSKTVSENGLNLVEELRQRLENKNKKIETGADGQDMLRDKQVASRPKSNTPKKLTISKNFNQQTTRVDNEEGVLQTGVKGATQTLKSVSVKENTFQQCSGSNPFSKIKKDTFFQLINHNNQSNLSNSHKNYDSSEPLTQIHPTEQLYRFQSISNTNNRNSSSNDGQKQGKHGLKYEKDDEVRQMYYESPIQGLNKSNYSNPEQERERQLMNNSKQMYENQVKKWKNRANQNSDSVSVTDHRKAQQNEVYLNQKPSLLKTPTLLEISKTVNQSIISTKPSSKISSSTLSAQHQYVQLLQTQISTLKHELSKCNQKISQLTYSEEKALRQNEILKIDDRELSERLEISEKRLSLFGEEKFVVEKYERLFDKMRNLLIINAMELIETKNFIELQFIPSLPNSLASSPQVTQKHQNSQQKPTHPHLQLLDCQQRIQSINQCLAKVQQTIEVSQRVVVMNRGRKEKESEQDRMTFGGDIQVKELEETLTYKDKIIHKLKEEITELKGEQNSANFKENIKQKHNQLTKPYSYVDQIHLLRHEITRLTQENCAFYQKYTQIKAELTKKQNLNKPNSFPNQPQILEIQSLINKLEKHNLDQLNNSKLEYWTSAKPSTHKKHPSPQTKKTETIKSKSKPKVVMTLLEKPKVLDFTTKPSFGSNETELLPGQEKIIRHSNEKYSSESKNQKIEYSKEEFSELVKEFKSSLSGLTPQKKSQKDKLNSNNQSHINNSAGKYNSKRQHNSMQTIELPTFRTPKQTRGNQQQPLGSTLKQPSQFLQQQQQSNESGYLQAISRLEYEKEFLASERENLIKENQKLIERINELEVELGNNDRVSMLKEEIYKLKFQNQQLVDRVVEAENLLASQNRSHQSLQSRASSSHPDSTQTLQSKQLQIQNLMKENIQLHKTVQSLQAKNQHLTKTLQSSKQDSSHPSQGQLDDHMSYMLAPSFESLIEFLKQLPEEKQEYHHILLKMIEGYERKVSRLREDNVWMKTKQKEVQDVVDKCGQILQKMSKFLCSQKAPLSSELSHQSTLKLQQQIYKTLSLITDLTTTYFSKSHSPVNSPHSSHPSLISSLQSKINYYLMLLRSFIQGIGESDLQLIESELSDYLKQLKCRIPTVLERDQFEESCQSSLNASVVQEDETYQIQQ